MRQGDGAMAIAKMGLLDSGSCDGRRANDFPLDGGRAA
jgi:hypothetical protein